MNAEWQEVLRRLSSCEWMLVPCDRSHCDSLHWWKIHGKYAANGAGKTIPILTLNEMVAAGFLWKDDGRDFYSITGEGQKHVAAQPVAAPDR